MAALATVGDYINDARVLLQDLISPYRYTDAELMQNINRGLLEIRRLRPDLMITNFGGDIPAYSASGDTVVLDQQYRVALLYYVCGQAQLRDEENVQDARATVFINKFTSQMLSIQS